MRSVAPATTESVTSGSSHCIPGDIATSVPERWYGYRLSRSYGNTTWCAANTESNPSRSAACATGRSISRSWSRPTLGSETAIRTRSAYIGRPAQDPVGHQAQQWTRRLFEHIGLVLRSKRRHGRFRLLRRNDLHVPECLHPGQLPPVVRVAVREHRRLRSPAEVSHAGGLRQPLGLAIDRGPQGIVV